MKDPRFEKLARQLVNYSLGVKNNERVLLDLCQVPEEMSIELIRAVREVGGVPFVRLSSPKLNREMMRGASEIQYSLLVNHQFAELKDMNCFIAIRGTDNVTEISDVAPDSMALAMRNLKRVQQHRINKTRWCVLRWPTPSMAQQNGMSTQFFEDFYFDVCTMDYSVLLPAMQKLKDLMERTNQVKILGEGTHLEFSIQGMPSVICAGNYNIPDGEVFTAPVKESVEGVIRYNTPTIFQGISFEKIELEFDQGRIIRAEAGNKTAQLNTILNTDEGARFIGEFAIGTNPKILTPMCDILFDEKIAGSFHFTPGQAYELAPNPNKSQVHWDLVCIQRKDYGGGEMYFDDVLVRRDGLFLDPELFSINPNVNC